MYTNNNEESVAYDNFSVKSYTLVMNSVSARSNVANTLVLLSWMVVGKKHYRMND